MKYDQLLTLIIDFSYFKFQRFIILINIKNKLNLKLHSNQVFYLASHTIELEC
jgi:hypothetical protein